MTVETAPKCKEGMDHDWYGMDDSVLSSTEHIEHKVCQHCYLIANRTFKITDISYDRRNYTPGEE